jgi:hypothetical protein
MLKLNVQLNEVNLNPFVKGEDKGQIWTDVFSFQIHEM